jgi:hypothetical protein
MATPSGNVIAGGEATATGVAATATAAGFAAAVWGVRWFGGVILAPHADATIIITPRIVT